ncbi:ferritin-like domain-containing protein, partial [Escherichia coli]|uniref:YciE/YciF ferroxidase family protein n=2 Tax=Escherichia coli TaxID=562 RepID=UPI003A4DA373
HHAFSSGAGRTSDGNGSHASTLKSPSYTKSVSWQHYRQIERIDQVVESESNLKIKRMKCVAMEGLIEEANEVIESTEKNEVRDAALIAAAQKVEHYEIASYGTLATLAEQLGYRKAAKLLKETLEEEKATDIKLTDLAINNVNKKAENKA